jgi:hypothetical protein
MEIPRPLRRRSAGLDSFSARARSKRAKRRSRHSLVRGREGLERRFGIIWKKRTLMCTLHGSKLGTQHRSACGCHSTVKRDRHWYPSVRADAAARRTREVPPAPALACLCQMHGAHWPARYAPALRLVSELVFVVYSGHSKYIQESV